MSKVDLNDLIGKPFDPDGYGPDGFSCYGLAREVHRRYGILIPKTNISVCACREASMQEIERHKKLYWEPLKRPEEPCAIIIRSQDQRFAHHIGTFIGSGRMIHISMDRPVTIDRTHYWKPNILGYYRYVGNAHKDT